MASTVSINQNQLLHVKPYVYEKVKLLRETFWSSREIPEVSKAMADTYIYFLTFYNYEIRKFLSHSQKILFYYLIFKK